MPDLSNIKAILFDLDGVLMMSNDLHSKAYEMAFNAEEIHDFFHTEISGMRTDEVVKVVLERNGRSISPSEIDRVTGVKRANAKNLFLEKVPVIEGCSILLQQLKAHYSLALATSASVNTANAFLDYENNRSNFDFVICGPEVEFSKPNPEIYQRAMKALNVGPTQCLVVEDSLNGIQAGKRAEAKVVAVKGTFESRKLISEGAFTVLENALGLPELLGL